MTISPCYHIACRAVLLSHGSCRPFGSIPDRICEPVIELGLMAYHQNASAICDQCTLQFVLGIHIEVVGGLVEDEYIGGTVDQLAETHLCLFTAGQDFDKAFNMLGCKAAFCEGGTHLINSFQISSIQVVEIS